MESPTALNPIQEEYLLAVLMLEKKNPCVPMSTLADHFHTHLAFARSAINGMVQLGLLDLSPHTSVHLTPEGGIRARDIERRRTEVAEALSETLDLDSTTAHEAARNLRQALSRADINWIICSRCRRRVAGWGSEKSVCCTMGNSVVKHPSSGHVLSNRPPVVEADSPEHGALF